MELLARLAPIVQHPLYVTDRFECFACPWAVCNVAAWLIRIVLAQILVTCHQALGLIVSLCRVPCEAGQRRVVLGRRMSGANRRAH